MKFNRFNVLSTRFVIFDCWRKTMEVIGGHTCPSGTFLSLTLSLQTLILFFPNTPLPQLFHDSIASFLPHHHHPPFFLDFIRRGTNCLTSVANVHISSDLNFHLFTFLCWICILINNIVYCFVDFYFSHAIIKMSKNVTGINKAKKQPG
ncbi:hypothetical protein Hanom_Chr12g01090351 [Helianthus anomalus]